MSLPHILLVDDDADILDTLGRLLRLFGLRITATHHADDALVQIATGTDFDVVLTDWHMPGMTGVELAQCIRGRQLDIPIVLTTGGMDTLPSELGFTGVHLVQKPVRANELAKTLWHLSQRRP